jgi:hypothetical protein
MAIMFLPPFQNELMMFGLGLRRKKMPYWKQNKLMGVKMG